MLRLLLLISTLVNINEGTASPSTDLSSSYADSQFNLLRAPGLAQISVYSCKDCFDELYWLLPPLAHHKFDGGVASIGGVGLFVSEDDASPQPQFETEVVEISSTSSDGDDEGNWLNAGSKDCEAFNACHGDIQPGYCHNFHFKCGGESLEIEYETAIRSGSVSALVELAARYPTKVLLVGERGVVQLFGCSGGLSRQDVMDSPSMKATGVVDQ